MVLGLDPGLRYTGWAVVGRASPQKIAVMAGGIIAPPPKKRMEDRLVEIHTSLKEVLQIYKPQVVALESVYVSENGSSTLKLGQARGVIMMTPALVGLEVFEYAPTVVKKATTGRGHANKDDIKKMLSLLLQGCEKLPKKHDVWDAVAVALCHIYSTKL